MDILRCPKCKGTLRLLDAAPVRLDCPTCRLRFAVRDGIPIMLLDEAEQY
jgi:uncharacterized protein YbaR (Trm112 family)